MIKKLIILFVRVYQKYVSRKIRNRCRFEPSCSEYMILAIEKYGAYKGLQKGVKRILRCKVPNNGIDYP